MPDPVTALTFVGSAVVSGVLGNRSDAGFKTRWDKFRNNLQQYRPDANHELAAAVYRSYLQATLQSCAVLLERNNLKVDGWFKLGVLPDRIAGSIRSLLNQAPAGVFTQANKKWLEAVSLDHESKLKQLDKRQLDVPFEYEHQEFSQLLAEIEVLMQPEEAHERERLIREALATRVLNDLESQFGEAPATFRDLVNESWFEFLCAGFQYYIKHQQEIANAFESRLLAKLVARSDWQQQLAAFGGESLKRIEAAQEQLLREQQKGFEQVQDLVKEESAKTRAQLEQHFSNIKSGSGPHAFSELEPLIHSLPTQQEIEGREEECAIILRAMSVSKQRVIAFAAPGGFGKTALLAKVVQQISAGDGTFRTQVQPQQGETIETNIANLLHVDCRNQLKLSALFADAGRLIGQEPMFQNIYNSEAALSNKLQEIFRRLSINKERRTWFLFDNFEPLLDDQGQIADAELKNFFAAIFAGDHTVYALVSGREVPRFSPREPVLDLTDVGSSLFGGLPLNNCVDYLRKNDADKGLPGNEQEKDTVLKQFADRVHRIPLALVWAVGYLRETNFTLRDILERQELFEDFDQDQARDAERYENKGLKRLHYEQLKIQSSDSLRILDFLALFKRPVPKGVLADLVSESELNKTLTRLGRNKLITRKQSADAYTRYLNHDLAVNLYALHPVICENEFFDTLPDKEKVYEIAAVGCWKRATAAYGDNRFAYAIELVDCAEKLFEHLTKEFGRSDLLASHASMLMNKGEALRSSAKLPEAVVEFDKAIVILERLVNIEHQEDATLNLASAYMNKGAALESLIRQLDAIVEYDKAIAILERLFNEESQSHVAFHLAVSYMNKSGALISLDKLAEAVTWSGKAIAFFELLVKTNPELRVIKGLALAYRNKGMALYNLTEPSKAVEEYDKAIVVLEQAVNDERQLQLASDLALVYVTKSNALSSLTRVSEAVQGYDKAIEMFERLVNDEQQSYLAEDLGGAYFSKARTLALQEDLVGALSCYEKSIKALTFCIENLDMFWILSELLRSLRHRLLILIYLERWESAAKDILHFFSLCEPYSDNGNIDQGFKESIDDEYEYLIDELRDLAPEHREELYSYLGDTAEVVYSLLEQE